MKLISGILDTAGLKTYAINVLAIGTTLTDVDVVIKIVASILAAVYTTLKIIELIRNMKKK